MENTISSLLWFRKGLRLHDNPALLRAAASARLLFPVFVLDPRYLRPDPSAPSPGSARAGLSRIRFLLESLSDLDASLRRLGSRLLVLRNPGDPADAVIGALQDWKIGRICYEFDTEPYYRELDGRVKEYASLNGIEVFAPVSHTLFNPVDIIQKNGGKVPLTYQSFVKIAGQPPAPVESKFSSLPHVGDVGEHGNFSVPTIEELGYTNLEEVEFSPFRGGESEAIKRLRDFLADKEKVASFEKPKGDPSAFLKPSTTILSPYLKFGCLSARYFYQCIVVIYGEMRKHTKPPVSLAGQLLWRDFFYTVAFGTPNFDQMKGNDICKQIPWKEDERLLAAWRDGQTGFPWIDAIMMQLRKWGWMHHLARHSVACFLTRGDLFIHWEKGRDVFERLLIDSDWAINNGNWLWLSCSSFFYQYYRIYSPTSFGKKYDPNGDYIRHFLPVLKDMPRQYIYEPWTAPLSVQREAHCIIGKDYPKPVVSHELSSKDCMRRMGEAYNLNSTSNSIGTEKDSKSTGRKSEGQRSLYQNRKLSKKQKHM